MLDPKISIFESPINSTEQWSQDYALSTVISGANKNLTQAATVHLHETAMGGVRGYHKTVLGYLKLNGKKIPPPPKVTLNEHNICQFKNGLMAYKQLNRSDSSYNSLRDSFAKYYSVSNDDIQKFSVELNGVMIRTLNDDLKITNVPWALTEIDGGFMDETKLCSQVVNIISNVNNFRFVTDNAALFFLRDYSKKFPEEIPPSPPSIFKCTTYEHIDWGERKLELFFENWPVALVGDGCSVNKKAGEILTSHIGLLLLTTRCSAHAASGTIRRITTSKTMSVPEVVTFASGIKPILKHFKLSGKSLASLQQCLEIMDMKPFKLMTWCPTRMANPLECSARILKMLFPICDMLAATGVKEEEASYFLSPNCLSILHMIADLEEVFVSTFLRNLDTDEATLFDVFRLSETFTKSESS